jgi:hypothetical protein
MTLGRVLSLCLQAGPIIIANSFGYPCSFSLDMDGQVFFPFFIEILSFKMGSKRHQGHLIQDFLL